VIEDVMDVMESLEILWELNTPIVASRRDLTAQLSARTNLSRKKLKEKKKK